MTDNSMVQRQPYGTRPDLSVWWTGGPWVTAQFAPPLKSGPVTGQCIVGSGLDRAELQLSADDCRLHHNPATVRLLEMNTSAVQPTAHAVSSRSISHQ